MIMDDIYIMNRNLVKIGVVDSYKSLIWANRYKTVGDCELYLPASKTMLDLLKKDYFLFRYDDDMVCQIKKIEIDTSAEDGNYIVCTGYGVKRWLDQRVVWTTMAADGNAESFVRDLVDYSIGSEADADRKITDENGNQLLYLGEVAGFEEALTEQVSYKNIGEKIREYCNNYGWGYRVVLGSVSGVDRFLFELYKGQDRSDSVFFSNDYENLNTTVYIEDDSKLGNVALVAGEGQGSKRSRGVSGEGSGMDRYEIYVDAKDISRVITWAELLKLYPLSGGSITGDAESGYVYTVQTLNVQVVDEAHLAELQEEYPNGQIIEISGVEYYQISNVIVADLPSDDPQDGDSVELRDIIYCVYLLTRGYEKLAEYGSVTSFEGTIEPNTTFVYKKDYQLGDIVTVENEYGISVGARIIEVVEVNDDNGYSVEPKFEYVSEV